MYIHGEINPNAKYDPMNVFYPCHIADSAHRLSSDGAKYGYELIHRMKRYCNVVVVDRKKTTVTSSHLLNSMQYTLPYMFERFKGADIVHHLDQKPLIYSGSAPLVTTAHEFMESTHPEFQAFGRKKTLKDKLMVMYQDYAIRNSLKSDYIIAVSTLVAEKAASLGYDRRKIKVINVGIDKRYSSPLHRPDRKYKRDFTVGWLCSANDKKQLPFAIRSFRKIKDNDLRLKVYGGGYGNDSFRLTGDDKRITFMGFAPEPKIVQIYDSFDVFLYPSAYEGFGMPIIEAQARGLPVIIYKAGLIPKEVRRYCFEAEDEDHMAQIITGLKSNGYNSKLRKKATEYARGFTWERNVAETFKFYKKILGQS